MNRKSYTCEMHLDSNHPNLILRINFHLIKDVAEKTQRNLKNNFLAH